MPIFFYQLITSIFLISTGHSVSAVQRWFEVVPSLGAAVDITSIRKVGNEYEARLRWKILNPNIDIYQEFNLPPDSFSIALEHIACTSRGPVSYQVEHWYQSADGQTLHHQIFSLKDQALARAREEQWLANTATPWSQILSNYGSDSRSFVCAYMTARCSKRRFYWPIPNYTPLEGPVDQLKALNLIHRNRFLPTCH